MDISAISNNLFCKESKLEKLPFLSSLTELSLRQDNKNRVCQSDALRAVKLDPAVLEAQVTIENNNCSKPKTDNTELQFKNKKGSSLSWDFEKAMLLQRAALFSLSSQQFSLLMKYVDILRHQRIFLQKRMECAFCKNNGHPDVWYTTHALKDRKGRVKCPILRTFSCPRCGATGDQAHTIKYCPQT